jgi:L-arabinose transport system ATP-binding protein
MTSAEAANANSAPGASARGAGAGLRVEGVSKAFAGVQALSDVSLDVAAGEVLALLGENGAGKSTLLKILSGDLRPDGGRVRLDGVLVDVSSPAQARHTGIRVVYQEPEIVPHVSVAENMYIGSLSSGAHRIDRRRFDRRRLLRRAQSDIDRLGFSRVISPGTVGDQLSPAQRQLVEILRAVTIRPKVLAFDEPTSSLSDTEVDLLFDLIARLRGEGVAVIYVSHRMKEIFRIADRVAVLRDGRLVGVRPTQQTDDSELVRMMTGRDLSKLFVRPPHQAGDVVLSVKGLTSADVTDVTFEVRAGEIVGMAGLVGAGRSELAHAIVGDVPHRAGEVAVQGRKLRLHSPSDAARAGIGFAPEERKAQALIMERSVRDNVCLVMLRDLARAHIVRRRDERRVAMKFVQQLRIRTPSVEQEVRYLSGGNQQKTVLARWLARRPKVLILDEPTRGVDVGAKAEIYTIINQLADEGMALLVISSEMPELMGLADRILVMHGGRITGELDGRTATEEQILRLAMGDQVSEQGAA